MHQPPHALHSNLVIFKLAFTEKGASAIESFTFQSGYIQMLRRCPYWPTLHLPLHSNLVIFKFIKKCYGVVSYDLYIPIWLYSNEAVITHNHPVSNFTFQSGYIQILKQSQLETAIKPLHSNLVIFKLINLK